MAYVIEFRNGTFYQNADADKGGPSDTAQKFSTVKEANQFMHRKENEWMLFAGGMALPFVNGKVQR